MAGGRGVEATSPRAGGAQQDDSVDPYGSTLGGAPLSLAVAHVVTQEGASAVTQEGYVGWGTSSPGGVGGPADLEKEAVLAKGRIQIQRGEAHD